MTVSPPGNTALLESICASNVVKTTILLNAGADIMIANNGGDTALHISALKGSLDITKVSGVFQSSALKYILIN